MTGRATLPAALALPALLLAAIAAPTCERELPRSSRDVATRDAELHLTVEGNAHAGRWLVWLLGPADPVRLEGGDHLVVDGALLAPAGDGAYAAELPPRDRGVLRLVRPGVAEDVRLVVELPPLTPIELATEARGGAPLLVRWPPAPGPWSTTVRAEGACLGAVELRLDVDEGEAALDLPPVAAACEVTIRLTRLVARELDAPPLARAPSRLVRWTEATVALAP